MLFLRTGSLRALDLANREYKLATIGGDDIIRKARERYEKADAKAQDLEMRMQASRLRRVLHKVLASHLSEAFIFAIIISNFALTIYETNLGGEGKEIPDWAVFCSTSFLIFYILELSARIYVGGRWFFVRGSDILDLVIVFVDAVCYLVELAKSSATPSPAVLRIFRIMRVFRAIRVIKQFHELYLMLYSLVSTLKAIFWAVVLIFMVLTCCSIVAVEVIHPINAQIANEGRYNEECFRCPDAYKTVWDANLTFIQQILAGDSWGEVSLPIIQKAPWTIVFFVFVLLTVNLGLMNLVLTVIVDMASEARKGDVEEAYVDKIRNFQRAKEKLVSICANMDVDQNGSITLEELLNGYDTNPLFASMLGAMDAKREDLPTVFKILDEDRSGDVTYAEFVEQLHKVKSQDSHTLLVFMQYYVTDLTRTVEKQMRLVERILERSHEHGELVANLAHSITSMPSSLEEFTNTFSQTKSTMVIPADDAGPVDENSRCTDYIFREDKLTACLPYKSISGPTPTTTTKDTFPPLGCSSMLRHKPSAAWSKAVLDEMRTDGLPVIPSNCMHRTVSAASATNSSQQGAARQQTCYEMTSSESRRVQAGIAKAIDIIIRDSLTISHERALEFTEHPDFLARLEGSGIYSFFRPTENRKRDISKTTSSI